MRGGVERKEISGVRVHNPRLDPARTACYSRALCLWGNFVVSSQGIGMLRSLCLALAVSLVSGSALAQTAPAPQASQPKAKKKMSRKEGAPAAAAVADPSAAGHVADPAAAPAPVEHAPAAHAAPVEPAAKVPTFDSEEFRRQVMEEVRKEL